MVEFGLVIQTLSTAKILEILLTSSLSLMAMLIAIIALLTARYEEVKKGPSWVYEPYRRLALSMVVILVISAVASLLNLAYLGGVLNIDSVLALQVVGTLFGLQIVGIVISAIVIAIKFLRKEA